MLLAGTLVFAGGCTLGDDDEMVPPTRTVTASPSPDTPAAPTAVPVGSGKVSPDDVVWSQGTVLHVGTRSVDVSPVRIDAFVVVPGGVFVLQDRELWFTDLSRLRGTGLTNLTALGVSADHLQLVLTREEPGGNEKYAFDAATGKPLDSDDVDVATAQELLGKAPTADPAGEGYTGFVPKRFSPIGQVGATRFFGLALQGDRPTAVVSCDTETHSCARQGVVGGPDPISFGTGM